MQYQFETEHQKWLQQHLSERQGERRRRLKAGHNHAEQEMLRRVWWPAFRSLEHLHPEYEVVDFREGRRFLDFAYIRGSVRIAIEVDGYGPHVRDLSRREYCDQWVRQMHLINDGWLVVRIGYDDLRERAKLWQQLFQQMIGRIFGLTDRIDTPNHPYEREVIRLARSLGRPFKMADVQQWFGCGYRLARGIIRGMEEKKLLEPAGAGKERIHFWKISENQNTNFTF